MKNGSREDSELEGWREVYRGSLPDLTAECPGDETLAELAVGEIDDARRREIADHVVCCPRCAEDFRLLLELQREAPMPVASRRWPVWAWVAAAAVVVLALWIAPSRVGDPGRPQTTPTDRARGVTQAVEPADRAELPAPPELLRWPAEAGATGYRVRLHAASADPIWESERFESPEAPLPAEIRTRFEAGRAYFWTVEVEGPAATRKLGPYWFRMVD
jgi:hypothetical protein